MERKGTTRRWKERGQQDDGEKGDSKTMGQKGLARRWERRALQAVEERQTYEFSTTREGFHISELDSCITGMCAKEESSHDRRLSSHICAHTYIQIYACASTYTHTFTHICARTRSHTHASARAHNTGRHRDTEREREGEKREREREVDRQRYRDRDILSLPLTY